MSITRVNKQPHIVTIGGGTGSSVMLRGLKKYTENISAIVTVADDGGGSGILREDLGMLPPGDIRACLVALSNSEEEMELLMRYRFDEKAGRLAGQSFGNLFLAAMNNIHGDFYRGLKEAAKVLAITDKVLPMTLENVVLYAELEDGSIIEGESNITFLTRKSGGRIKRVFLQPELSLTLDEAKEDIAKADLVILGPGSLYTSVIPNLLVKDLTQAIRDSKAPVVYICNVMTQPGETDQYTAADHLRAIADHCGENLVDAIYVNNKRIPEAARLRYEFREKSTPIHIREEEIALIQQMGTQVITGDFVDVKHDYIRHDADALGKILVDSVSIND